jgi:meiotic recombination protein SPO11
MKRRVDNLILPQGRFLKKIKNEINLPVHALFDCDPDGLRILSVYMFGSKKISYDSFHLTTEGIQWLLIVFL